MTSVVPVSGGNFQTGSAATTVSSGGGGGILPGQGGSSTPVGTTTPLQPDITLLTQPKTIYNVQIMFVTETTASVTFDTTTPALSAIQYKSGKVSGSSGLTKQYSYTHSHTLFNLTPGTIYSFDVYTQWNDNTFTTFTSHTYTFTTLKVQPTPAKLTAPIEPKESPVPEQKQPLVTNLSATTKDESVVDLSWSNPRSNAYKEVWLVRGTDNFPQSPDQGTTVYRGLAESFTDANVDTTSQEYYYTLFLIDAKGRVVSATPAKSLQFEKQQELPEDSPRTLIGTTTEAASESGCVRKHNWTLSWIGLTIAVLSLFWWWRIYRSIYLIISQQVQLEQSS